jgi:MFS family permease
LLLSGPSNQRWRQLTLLAVVELLGMSVWLAASAVKPALTASLSLSVSEAGWLTSGVQLGFVVGTMVAAFLNLADVVPARFYVAASALIAAVSNLGLLVADSFEFALVSRIITGIALAGVYPPAMKMAATWFKSGRGLAIGTVVGALTAGKALPYFIGGLGIASLTEAVAIPSVAAALAACLVLFGYQDGPHRFMRRAFSWRLVGTVMREPQVRRATAGYLGHMWELYAFWTWVPGYLMAALVSGGHGTDRVGLWAAVVVAAGAVGAVWGGLVADRVGRYKVVRVSLKVSGACCLVSPLLFNAPVWLLMAVSILWGVAVVADSAQFSAMVTEHAPSHAVGTALTLQTSLGFLLTIVTIQGVPWVAGLVGWRWAMIGLVLGPLAGLKAMKAVQITAPTPSLNYASHD